MVNVLVDGKPAVVKAGVNLVEAAKVAGVHIPFFCYHSCLSIAGQCRLCLVETADAPGRLIPACHARVREGLHIVTNTAAVRDARRAVMEFHLVNHPVDCAICDQAGECKLQDYYQAYDWQPSRIATHKLSKPKRKIFGPLVVYDGERCILCTRCVRFMKEIALEPQLAMVGRGDHSEIETTPGGQLDSAYSLNTADICPVGALLSRDFRFTTRVWYLDNVRSVCPGCANGCNMSAEHRGGIAYRLLPRRNEEVNAVWMCDEGRLTYHRTNDKRVRHARIGRPGTGPELPPDAETAAKKAWEALAPVAPLSDFEVAISAQLSTEEMFAAAAFTRDVLKMRRVYATGRASGKGDDFLVREDRNPNSTGLALVAETFGLQVEPFSALLEGIARGAARHLLMFGGDVPDEASAAPALAGLSTFVLLAANESPVTEAATVLLPLSTYLEQSGTFVNYYGRLQPFREAFAPRWESLPAWARTSGLCAAAGAAWRFASAADAYSLLAAKVPALAGTTLADLPETGIVLPGRAPARFAARAPRPAGMGS